MGMTGVPIGQRPPATSMRCVYYSAIETHFLHSNDVAKAFWTSDLADLLKPGQIYDATGIQCDPLLHSLLRHVTPFEEFCAGPADEENAAYEWLRGALGTSEMPFKLKLIDFDKLGKDANKNHYFQPLRDVVGTLKASEASWHDAFQTGVPKAHVTRLNRAIRTFASTIGAESVFDTSRWNSQGVGLKWAKVNSRIVADQELCDKQAALAISYFFFLFISRRLPEDAGDEFSELAKAEVKNDCLKFRSWARWALKFEEQQQ